MELPNGMKFKQQFINAQSDAHLTGIKADGVCGMAFSTLSDGIPTIMDNLYN